MGQNPSTIEESSDEEEEESSVLWFFKDRHGMWQKYGHKGEWGRANIRSSKLEQEYNSNRCGKVSFSSNSYNYVIDFERMIQTNLQTGVQRPVKREGLALVPYRRNPQESEIIKDIDPDTFSLYEHTGSDLFIVEQNKKYHLWIKRLREISNLKLLEDFAKAKLRLKTTNGGIDANEEFVYHGTKNVNAENIAKEGFNTKPTGKDCRNKFGRGSYFTKFFTVAHKHSLGHNTVIIAKIITGKTTQGKKGYESPPHLDNNYKDKGRYNSCVGTLQGKEVNVVFKKDQIYPRYIVNYDIKFVEEVECTIL